MNWEIKYQIHKWRQRDFYNPYIPKEQRLAELLKSGKTNDLPLLKLPLRTIGFLKYGGLLNLDDIITHYIEYQTFQMFPGCSERIDNELIIFCKNALHSGHRPKCPSCRYHGYTQLKEVRKKCDKPNRGIIIFKIKADSPTTPP